MLSNSANDMAARIDLSRSSPELLTRIHQMEPKRDGSPRTLVIDREKHEKFYRAFSTRSSDNTDAKYLAFASEWEKADSSLRDEAVVYQLIDREGKQEPESKKRRRRRAITSFVSDPVIYGASITNAIDETLRTSKTLDDLPPAISQALASSSDLMVQESITHLLGYEDSNWLNASVSLQQLRQYNDEHLHAFHRTAAETTAKDPVCQIDVAMSESICPMNLVQEDGAVLTAHPYTVAFALYACISEFVRQCRLNANVLESPQNPCKSCERHPLDPKDDVHARCLSLYCRVRLIISGDETLLNSSRAAASRCRFCSMLVNLAFVVVRWFVNKSVETDSGETLITLLRSTESCVSKPSQIDDPDDDLPMLSKPTHFGIPLGKMFTQAIAEFRNIHVLMQACHTRLYNKQSIADHFDQRMQLVHPTSNDLKKTARIKHLLDQTRPSDKQLRSYFRTPHFVRISSSVLENKNKESATKDSERESATLRARVHEQKLRDVAHTSHVYNAIQKRMARKRKIGETAYKPLVETHVDFCKPEDERVSLVMPRNMNSLLQEQSASRYSGKPECFEDQDLFPTPGCFTFVKSLVVGSDIELYSSLIWLYQTMFTQENKSKPWLAPGIMLPTDPSFALYRLLPLLLCVDSSDRTVACLWQGIQAPYVHIDGLVTFQQHLEAYNNLTRCAKSKESSSKKTSASHGELVVLEDEFKETIQEVMAMNITNQIISTRLKNAVDQTPDGVDPAMMERMFANDCIRKLKAAGKYDASKDGMFDQEAEDFRLSLAEQDQQNTVLVDFENTAAEEKRESLSEHRRAELDALERRRAMYAAAVADKPDGNESGTDTDDESNASSMFMSEFSTDAMDCDHNPVNETKGGKLQRRQTRWKQTRVVYNFQHSDFYASMLAFLAPRKTAVKINVELMSEVWQCLLGDPVLWIDHRHLVVFLIELMQAPDDVRSLLRESGSVRRYNAKGVPLWLIWRTMRADYYRWCESKHTAETQSRRSKFGWTIDDSDSTSSNNKGAAKNGAQKARVGTKACTCTNCGWLSYSQKVPTNLCFAPATFVQKELNLSNTDPTANDVRSFIAANYGNPDQYASKHQTCLRVGPYDPLTGVYDPLCPVPPRPHADELDLWAEPKFRVQFTYSSRVDRRHELQEYTNIPTHSRLLPDMNIPLHFLFYVFAADPRVPREVSSRVFADVQARVAKQPLAPPNVPLDSERRSTQYERSHQRVSDWFMAQTSKYSSSSKPNSNEAMASYQRSRWLQSGCPPLSTVQIKGGNILPLAPLVFVATALEAMTHLPYNLSPEATDRSATPALKNYTRSDRVYSSLCKRSTVGAAAIQSLVNLPALISMLELDIALPVAMDQRTKEMYTTKQLVPLFDSPFSDSHNNTNYTNPAVQECKYSMFSGPLTYCNTHMVDAVLAFPITHIDMSLTRDNRLRPAIRSNGMTVYDANERSMDLRSSWYDFVQTASSPARRMPSPS